MEDSEKDGGCPFYHNPLRTETPSVICDTSKTILIHEISQYDFQTQTNIIYQVMDDYLDIGSQRIVVKGTAATFFVIVN